MGPARWIDCCLYGMRVIWYVMFSNQAWLASQCAIILASLARLGFVSLDDFSYKLYSLLTYYRLLNELFAEY
jgi:hypothetical protein